MLVPDVNVLVNARFSDATFHGEAIGWLERARRGDETLGVPELVMSAFIRIVTSRQGFANAISTSDAFSYCQALRLSPAFIALAPGHQHWSAFRDLVEESGVYGRDVSDAYLAAFAIENNATFVTFDRGFARFPGLRVWEPA